MLLDILKNEELGRRGDVWELIGCRGRRLGGCGMLGDYKSYY